MMDHSEDRRQGEGKNNDDRDLTDELESLYHRVVQSDKSHPSDERKADARVEEDKSGDLRPGRDHYRYLQDQDEMMKKLRAISEAYERILTYWPYARERMPQSDTAGVPEKIPIPDTSIEDGH